MKLKVIITGTTGMVGEGVMHECLNHPDVQEVLTVTRKPVKTNHPKLKNILLDNFSSVESIQDQLSGYDACYFCLGVSSIGLQEKEFTAKTYDLTMGFAKVIAAVNPNLTFTYVSGAGTDSTEKGKSMWARVKGKTENDLMNLFPKSYMFRPGYMQPTKGLYHTLKYYRYMSWMYPALRTLLPSFVSTLAELGQAMINVTLYGYDKKILEVKDIVQAASIGKK